ncbi:MAG: hypothetical protein NVS3B24_19040 [Candidatus Dormibacteria bacterium]
MLPQHRGHGVGSRLADAAEEWSSAHGAEVMTMSTHVANVDAIRIYQERHGFRTTGILMMKRPAADL